MRKLCLNAPRKITTKIQVWVSVLLIVLSVILSFGPISSLDLADEETVDAINEYVNELVSADIPEIPSKVDITAIKLVNAVRFMGKSLSAMMNSGKPKGEKAEQELKKMALNDDGTLKESMVDTMMIVSVSVWTVFGGISSGTSSMGAMIGGVITILALLVVYVLTIIIPITLIIYLLTAISPALKGLKGDAAGAAKVSSKLADMLPLPLFLLLLQALIPGLKNGSATIWITVFSIINIALNTVMSRLRDYTEDDLKLLNIVQCCSVFSVIGFLIFFFKIIKTGVVSEFIAGPWASYAELAKKAKDVGEDVSNGYIIDAVLIYLTALLILIAATTYIIIAVRRLSLTSKKGKRGNGGYIGTSCIVMSVIAIVSTLIPKYVQSSGNNDMNGEAESFLVLSDAQSSALTMALIGAIIMLASEIVIVVLKKKFCPQMTEDDVNAVLEGKSKTPEEKVAEAQEVLDRAQEAVDQAKKTLEQSQAAQQAPAPAAPEAPAEAPTASDEAPAPESNGNQASE